MKNTLTISTYNPTLLSKTDDGTNRFFIRLRCDLEKNPRIIFSDSTVTPTTSDFLYEVSSAKWLGSGTLTFTVSDDDGSKQYSVDKFSGASATSNLMMLEDSSFAYHFVDVNASSGDEYGLSITGRILSIILGGGSSSVEIPAGQDGRGIVSITKTGTSGLVDTYTVLYTDNTTSTFTVTNGADGDDGRGIVSITKTSSSGLVDTYTISYTSGNDSTFTVTNGADGSPGAPGAAAGFGTPTASIDANTGTPSVTVTASGPDTAKVFAFDFKNLKGATGATGSTGPQGPTGPSGASAGFGTPTASVDANVGTPSVTITSSGPDTAKVFDFDFKNLKGEQGQQGQTGATGNGIYDIQKTGTSGAVDTYTIYYTNGQTTTFTVTNGTSAAWNQITNKPFSSLGGQFNVVSDVLKLKSSFVSDVSSGITTTGSGTEASPTKSISLLNVTTYALDGSYSTTTPIVDYQYMEYSKTANTDSDGGTTFTFTNSNIGIGSTIDVYCDVADLPFKSCSVSGTTCTVKFPATTATTIKCRIYIRND